MPYDKRLDLEELKTRRLQTIMMNEGVNRGIPIKRTNLLINLPFWHPDCQGSSFVSRDAQRFTMTNTGPTGGSTGLLYDGSDDLSTFPDDPLWTFGTSDLAFEFWLKTPSTASRQVFTQSNDTDNDYLWVRKLDALQLFVRENSANILTVTTDDVVVVANVWAHFVVTRLSGTWYVYKDKVSKAITVGGTVGAGATFPNFTTPPRIGARLSGGVNYEFLNGTLGEFRAYYEGMTAAEVTQNYEVTKWRYQ